MSRPFILTRYKMSASYPTDMGRYLVANGVQVLDTAGDNILAQGCGSTLRRLAAGAGWVIEPAVHGQTSLARVSEAA